jgi:hypothetical protein
MTNITNGQPDPELRPEDATTLAEFQARHDAELARIREARRSKTVLIRLVWVFLGAVPIAFLWYWFWQSSGTGKWGILALAVACQFVVVAIANRIDGTKRRRELTRLSKQWKARA